MRNTLSCHMWRLLKKTRLYGLTLKRKPVQTIHPIQREHWRGNMRLGQELMTGGINLGDQYYSYNEFIQSLQQLNMSNDKLFNYTQSFAFLPDLASMIGPESRKRSRQLIEHWIYSHHSIASKSWLTTSWSLGLVGFRLFTWLSLYDFYASTADDEFKNLLNTSIAQQLTLLSRHWRLEKNPLHLLWAFKALFLAAEMKLVNDDMKDLLIALLHFIKQQILSDGGHVSRTPLLHWQYLRDFIDIRYSLQHIVILKFDATNVQELLADANEMTMESIQSALNNKVMNEYELLKIAIQYVHYTIHKMTPILRLLRHVDGKLATVGGDIPSEMRGIYTNINADAIDNVLSVTDAQVTRPPQRAPDFGIERCSNRNSVMLVNTFPHASHYTQTDAHQEAGLNFLEIEWSVGQHRLLQLADVMIQTPSKGFLTNLDPQALQLTVKRSLRDGDHYLELNAFYDSKDGLINWQRHIYLTRKSEELRVMDVFNLPINCILALRFQMHNHVTFNREGEKIICALNAQTSQKREMPLRKNATYIDPAVLFPQNAVPMAQHTGKASSKNTQSLEWLFRALGADEVLVTEQEESERTILCFKEYEAGTSAVFKWSFSKQA